ncbi:hypothetical protein NG798_04400 [Ancylothrix sp. C2]|nr:hypothetical protein [Ancylothrix sp. D3o]MCT7949019.1 hypothetical protein [Ancylothrix sp. D3o]
MGYETIKNLKPEEFKRFCGVRAETFEQRVKVLEEHEKSKKNRRKRFLLRLNLIAGIYNYELCLLEIS